MWSVDAGGGIVAVLAVPADRHAGHRSDPGGDGELLQAVRPDHHALYPVNAPVVPYPRPGIMYATSIAAP